jgi:hypothetical protein
VPRPDDLDEVARALSAAITARLTADGHLPLAFYPAFRADDDPASGFDTGDPPPRFSTGYTGARNRLGILVETHSWRTYQERAISTYRTLAAVVELAVSDAAAWQAACERADQAIARVSGTPVELLHTADATQHREIEFRGYAYERVPSDVSGATWTRYDETRPQIWKVPLHDHLVPVITATPPAGGYIVDGGFAAAIAPLLDLHGVTYHRLHDEWPAVDLEAFHVSAVTFDPPYEGRTRARLTGAWQREQRTYAKGAIYVPAGQAAGRLVLHLFEPASIDSLAQWGFFNTVFEVKEYMEGYVIEEVAREMLAKDPAVAKAWQEALAADPELAKSPQRRLEWFYRRHPAWDARRNVLPVYRIDTDLHTTQVDDTVI